MIGSLNKGSYVALGVRDLPRVGSAAMGGRQRDHPMVEMAIVIQRSHARVAVI